MTMTRRAALAGLAIAHFRNPAARKAFPNRTVTIVVPYPPGGPIDTLARLIAQEAAADLGQPIVVENRPGASGIVGIGAVARAEPDGHTLVLGTNQTHATNQSLIKNWTFDAVKDSRRSPASPRCRTSWWCARSFRRRVSAMWLRWPSPSRRPHLRFDGQRLRRPPRRRTVQDKAGIDMLQRAVQGLAPMTTELLAGRIDSALRRCRG